MANRSDAGSCTSLTVAATGLRRFTVDGYSLTKRIALPDDGTVYYQSGEFSVGGHVWAVRYYPAVRNLSCCMFEPVMVTTAPGCASAAATFVCAPLDCSGEEVKGKSQSMSAVFVRGKSPDASLPICFSSEDLERGDKLIVDDCLTVKCTVSVLKDPQSV